MQQLLPILRLRKHVNRNGSNGDESATLALAPGRRAYVHVARGSVAVNGERLAAGDAAKLTQAAEVRLAQGEAAEVLVFDLP